MRGGAPEYIRDGATIFEHKGVKYGYKLDGDDLYIDGPSNDPTYNSCYIIRKDGIIDGENGAVPAGQQPDWVIKAIEIAKQNGDW
jgi:hypothetical protein